MRLIMADWTDEAPAVDVPCPFACQGGVRRRVADTVWGAPEAVVCRCSACEIVFIHPTMEEEEERQFYEAEFAHYMRDRGGAGETQPEEHFEKNRDEAKRRVQNLLPYLRPGMRVLEIGSATGFLLEALRPHVGSVTGVEPGQLYAAYANARGIPTMPSLYKVMKERFDLILAYYVVEHLQHPIERLRNLRGLLAPDGVLAIEVPNVDDALVRFYKLGSFDRFYWQKAHYFNYSTRTLTMVLERAGFTATMLPEQRYDISNHLHWLLTGQSGGKGKYTRIFDQQLDREYARCLKTHWLCDTIFAVAVCSQQAAG
jgi:SAM-dependent methyltransferase